MIKVSWLDILAGAIAAAKAEGRDIGGAELDAVRSVAKGIASVLGGTVESPGTVSLFAGSGSGLTDLDASHIASGTVGDAYLSANVGLLNGTQEWTGSQFYDAGVLKIVATPAEIGQTAIYSLAHGARTATFPNANGAVLFADGSGAALTALNASSISSGTLADARLSTNVALWTPTMTSGRIPFMGGAGALVDDSTLVWDATNHRLGIGATAPAMPLHVSATAAGAPYFAQIGIEPSAANSDAAMYLKTTRSTGRAWFFGVGTGGVGDFGQFRIYDITGAHPAVTWNHAGWMGLNKSDMAAPLHVYHSAPGSAPYAQVYVQPTAANSDAAICLETTQGAGRQWFIAAGTPALSNTTGLRIVDLALGQRFGIDNNGCVYAVATSQGFGLVPFGGSNPTPVLCRDASTDDVLLRATGASGVVKVQDSAGAATDVVASNVVRTSILVNTDGPYDALPNGGYIVTSPGHRVRLPDPALCGIGTRVRMRGDGSVILRITQRASQRIAWSQGGSATTTGTGGYMDLGSETDAVELECVTGDGLQWFVTTFSGDTGAPFVLS